MLEQLLDHGWAYHDSESERLARELEAAGIAGVPCAQLSPFVHLATHTIGQHLQDWPRALALVRSVVEALPQNMDIGDVSERLYVSAVMAGDAIGAAQFELKCLRAASDALASLLSMRFLLADVLIDGGRRAEGGRLFGDALAIAARIVPPPALEYRIAATSNNLAWILHDLPSRTVDDIALMSCAAQASLAAWRRCGDWINVELAFYLNASVARAGGDPAAALALSAEGLEVIAAHGKRPLDAARFHLLRGVSFAALGNMEERAHALRQADDAARDIVAERLMKQFLAERARAASITDRPSSNLHRTAPSKGQ
jgi:hypothetical protein